MALGPLLSKNVLSKFALIVPFFPPKRMVSLPDFLPSGKFSDVGNVSCFP